MLTGMTAGPLQTPTLWMTASSGLPPSRSTATRRTSSRSAKSPITRSAPRASSASRVPARSRLRACTTTSCPARSRDCAVRRPRPSADPVTKTLLTVLLAVEVGLGGPLLRGLGVQVPVGVGDDVGVDRSAGRDRAPDGDAGGVHALGLELVVQHRDGVSQRGLAEPEGGVSGARADRG